MRILKQTLEDIVDHARRERPRECCGVLLGMGDDIVDAVRALNIADSPGRYLINPADHLAARREARRLGMRVTGFYHSHPQSEARPSPVDLAEATYPDCLYLIVSLMRPVAETRAFRLDLQAFVEIPLTVVDASDGTTGSPPEPERASRRRRSPYRGA